MKRSIVNFEKIGKLERISQKHYLMMTTCSMSYEKNGNIPTSDVFYFIGHFHSHIVDENLLIKSLWGKFQTLAHECSPKFVYYVGEIFPHSRCAYYVGEIFPHSGQ